MPMNDTPKLYVECQDNLNADGTNYRYQVISRHEGRSDIISKFRSRQLLIHGTAEYRGICGGDHMIVAVGRTVIEAPADVDAAWNAWYDANAGMRDQDEAWLGSATVWTSSLDRAFHDDEDDLLPGELYAGQFADDADDYADRLAMDEADDLADAALGEPDAIARVAERAEAEHEASLVPLTEKFLRQHSAGLITADELIERLHELFLV